MDIEKAYQDRYTLAPLPGQDHHRFSGTLCDRCLYVQLRRGHKGVD
jgi:hypothetical protein